MTFVIGTPHTRGAGYLLDNQNFSVSRRTEADIQTCPHCQAVINMQQWRDNGSWCSKCNAPTCADGTECAKKTALVGCVPYFKFLETVVKTEYEKAQLRRLMGLEPEPPPQPFILNP
jgi:hypothetical protein